MGKVMKEKEVNTMSQRVPIREDVFTEGPEGGKLLANKCRTCGQVFFPKALFCLTCFGKDMEGIELSRRGKLYSYTIARMASMHFEAPYAIGYVNMPEGVRVFAPLKMLNDQAFAIGMEMEVVIENLWQEGDKDIIGYKFKAV